MEDITLNMLSKKRKLLKNTDAIAEEFTSIPALSVVMIGFAIFILLLANTYNAYNTRIESLDKYQTADFLLIKLTNPDSYLIKDAGLIDLPKMKQTQQSDQAINEIREKYQASGVDFIIQISYQNQEEKYPSNANTLLSNAGDRVAISKNIGVYLNEAQTVPGKLTIISWNVS